MLQDEQHLRVLPTNWVLNLMLWELVTRGSLPYPGMSNQQVCDALTQGYYMPIPKGFPKPFKSNHGKLSDNGRLPFQNICII